MLRLRAWYVYTLSETWAWIKCGRAPYRTAAHSRADCVYPGGAPYLLQVIAEALPLLLCDNRADTRLLLVLQTSLKLLDQTSRSAHSALIMVIQVRSSRERYSTPNRQ